MVPPVQSIWQCARSEPSLGSVLPRIPTHLTPTATTDQPRTAVCQSKTSDVPRPGACSTWQLYSRTACGQNCTDPELIAGHHIKTAASKTLHQG
jgi:hypothetical protein